MAVGCKKICEAYLSAPEKWEKEGIKTFSVDEKTGIQALERAAPDLPMKEGHARKQEYEYIRHGTQCLIANWDVVNGGIVNPRIKETRTEQDFCEHIQKTIEEHKGVTQFCFIADNLNTHQSESLVRFVAQTIKEKTNELIELGEKGKRGILKSMKSRAKFLTDLTHPVHFIYTPRHCSWLNQIEMWFGVFDRKLLKRGNFKSKKDLKEQIEKFILYYNETMAKPFKWTFKGQPLKN